MERISHPSSLPQSRAILARVLSSAGDIITIDEVAQKLQLSRSEAAKRLSRWLEQGWMRRVGRGVYVPVALDTLGAEQTLDDPWVIVPPLFEPAYIAGRTAAEYWDLTEQIFNDVVVITGRPVRQKKQSRHGTSISLKHIAPEKIFGTKSVWRHHTKVQVSDVHRTIIDMLDDPGAGGGIQHVSECLAAYFKRKDRDDEKLIDYAARLGNGAVFKRLGFLSEFLQAGGNLSDLCKQHLTSGLSKLDSSLPSPRVATKWHLRIPESWSRKSLK